MNNNGVANAVVSETDRAGIRGILWLTPEPAALRILIVNQDMRSADCLRGTLQDLGYSTIMTAYSARRALVAATEFIPTVALLDLDLPDMTGFQLARQFRSHRMESVRRAHLLAVMEPFVIQNADVIRAAGFVGSVTKPVPLLELNALLRKVREQTH